MNIDFLSIILNTPRLVVREDVQQYRIQGNVMLVLKIVIKRWVIIMGSNGFTLNNSKLEVPFLENN